MQPSAMIQSDGIEVAWWCRGSGQKNLFALLRGALLCLRGSRGNRKLATNIHETDFEIERGLPDFLNRYIVYNPA